MNPDLQPKPTTNNWNKIAYTVFLVVGISFVFINDLSQAVIFWCLALVFDPFDPSITFSKRPLYQRIWLLLHLATGIGLFVLLVLKK